MSAAAFSRTAIIVAALSSVAAARTFSVQITARVVTPEAQHATIARSDALLRQLVHHAQRTPAQPVPAAHPVQVAPVTPAQMPAEPMREHRAIQPQQGVVPVRPTRTGEKTAPNAQERRFAPAQESRTAPNATPQSQPTKPPAFEVRPETMEPEKVRERPRGSEAGDHGPGHGKPNQSGSGQGHGGGSGDSGSGHGRGPGDSDSGSNSGSGHGSGGPGDSDSGHGGGPGDSGSGGGDSLDRHGGGMGSPGGGGSGGSGGPGGGSGHGRGR